MQLPPSPPTRRRSLTDGTGKPSSPDPPSPPLRRRSDPKLEVPEITLPPTLPQRRGTMEHNTEYDSEAEDDSILDSPRQEDVSPYSSVRKSSWFPLMSGDSDHLSPPVMPRRKPSGNDIDKVSRKDNRGPSNGDFSNARWHFEVPPPPPLLVSE